MVRVLEACCAAALAYAAARMCVTCAAELWPSRRSVTAWLSAAGLALMGGIVGLAFWMLAALVDPVVATELLTGGWLRVAAVAGAVGGTVRGLILTRDRSAVARAMTASVAKGVTAAVSALRSAGRNRPTDGADAGRHRLATGTHGAIQATSRSSRRR